MAPDTRSLNPSAGILVVLNDHDRRVRIRRMIEDTCDLTVYTVANPVDGLALLDRIPRPAFILLSSNDLPLMSYLDFIARIGEAPNLASIPIVLLSTTPANPLPSQAAEEVKAPVSQDDIFRLIGKYCRANTREK